MSGATHARLQHAPCAAARPPAATAAAAVVAGARQRMHQHLGVAPAAAQHQQQHQHHAELARPFSSRPWQRARGRAAPPRAAADTAAQAAAAAAALPAPGAGGEPSRRPAPLYKMPKEPLAEFGFSNNFSDKYELLDKIGKGASCTVHAARCRATGEKCAWAVRDGPRAAWKAGAAGQGCVCSRCLPMHPPPAGAAGCPAYLHMLPAQPAILPAARPLASACRFHLPPPTIASVLDPTARVAVKVMPKRLGPDGFLEKAFARRVRNEVDISTHLGRRWAGAGWVRGCLRWGGRGAARGGPRQACWRLPPPWRACRR